MTYFIRHRHVAAVALVAACLLGGCSEKPSGTEKNADPQVASLQSASPKSEATKDVNDERPLLALDATDEDLEALRKPWGKCVREQGGPGYENPRQVNATRSAKNSAILKACLSKEPETFEERQKRQNLSEFRDNQRQWYKCAQKAGYKLTAPDENGEFGLTAVGPNGDARSPKMEACRKEAFKD